MDPGRFLQSAAIGQRHLKLAIRCLYRPILVRIARGAEPIIRHRSIAKARPTRAPMHVPPIVRAQLPPDDLGGEIRIQSRFENARIVYAQVF